MKTDKWTKEELTQLREFTKPRSHGFPNRCEKLLTVDEAKQAYLKRMEKWNKNQEEKAKKQQIEEKIAQIEKEKLEIQKKIEEKKKQLDDIILDRYIEAYIETLRKKFMDNN